MPEPSSEIVPRGPVLEGEIVEDGAWIGRTPIRRGPQQPKTATIRLDNRTGRFRPTPPRRGFLLPAMEAVRDEMRQALTDAIDEVARKHQGEERR